MFAWVSSCVQQSVQAVTPCVQQAVQAVTPVVAMTTEEPAEFWHKFMDVQDPMEHELMRIVFYSQSIYGAPADWVKSVLFKIRALQELSETEKDLFDQICQSFNAKPEDIHVLITDQHYSLLRLVLDEKIKTKFNQVIYPDAVKKMNANVRVVGFKHIYYDLDETDPTPRKIQRV